MAVGANTHTVVRLAALILAGVLALLAFASAPAPAAASACTKYGEVRADNLRPRQARSAVRCLVNRQRKQHGLRTLDRDKRLQRAAQKHTDVMMKKGCFSHQCSGEGSLASRLRVVDYLLGGLLRWTYGENIGYGGSYYGTPKAMVKAWMKSPGHRANILNPAFRDLGVGVLPGTPGSPNARGGLYTTDFGMRLLG